MVSVLVDCANLCLAPLAGGRAGGADEVPPNAIPVVFLRRTSASKCSRLAPHLVGPQDIVFERPREQRSLGTRVALR